ncbi:MAG TPA: FAD-dependent oxidoreductase [Usitatibacteraceae bacterium]|nr:FAD-dependent oxidoreductase [Usitatibacteraceae bacterium]
MNHLFDPQRRRWLGAGAGLVTMGTLGACSAWQPAGPRRPFSTLPFARPDLRDEFVLREPVGARPFRRNGFVVRREAFGDKHLVHHYGHGGAGITLSWGSALQAADTLDGQADRRAVVIGAGVVGLSTARVLQQRGWTVRLVAQAFSPDTTSDVAGGQFAPTAVLARSVAEPASLERLDNALRASHAHYLGLIGRGYGVQWRENYHLLDASRGDAIPEYVTQYPELFPDAMLLAGAEHPFPVTEVFHYRTLLIEPGIYLSRLMADFLAAGGSAMHASFQQREELLMLPEPVLVNCTGLGARWLFGDEELMPVRGQLVIVRPDPAMDYLTHGGGEGLLYCFPRSDGIVLGGSFQRGEWDYSPDPAISARILGEHRRLFAAMRIA